MANLQEQLLSELRFYQRHLNGSPITHKYTEYIFLDLGNATSKPTVWHHFYIYTVFVVFYGATARIMYNSSSSLYWQRNPT